MKRLFLSLLVFVFCLSFVYGQLRIVGANWDSRCPVLANDFHVDIDLMSANNVIPRLNTSWSWEAGSVWYLNALNIFQDGVNPQLWHAHADFKTTGGGWAHPGDLVHFGIEFYVDGFNFIRVFNAWWTRNGVNVAPAILMGFNVWERPGFASTGSVVTLFNDSQQSIAVEQLEFAVTNFHVPLQDMFYTGLGAPGEPGKYPEVKWVPAGAPIQIGPGQNVEIDLSPLGVTIPPDNFLQFRANINGLPQWFQHQQ